MITGKEVHVLDKNAEYRGVPTIELMENAGRGVADFIKNELGSAQKKILILCGPGNNGGDGFVAARYLSTHFPVTVFLTEKQIRTDVAKQNYQKLQKLDITIHSKLEDLDQLLQDHEVLIDALLGIGIVGSLREPYLTIVKKINSVSKKLIISVDVPTGLGTDHAIRPNHTVTFHDSKDNMNKSNSGDIHIVDIGIPKEAITHVGPGELSVYYPRPRKQSHKGENGCVLVIGGGPYVGAPLLSALAVLRTGADLVFVATPKRSFPFVAGYSPNLIVKDLHSDVLIPEDVSIIQDMLSRCSSVIIGPGLGSAPETAEAVVKIVHLLATQKKPMVIDADAIKPLGKHPEILQCCRGVITPHQREFNDLTGVTLSDNLDENIRFVQKWAHHLNISIFLKGYIDVLSDGKNTKLNNVHNEAMTVGGTGDVLTGILGALLSKSVDPFTAMRIAAFLNGEAGNEAFNKKSYGLLATDVIEEIPTILKKYL